LHARPENNNKWSNVMQRRQFLAAGLAATAAIPLRPGIAMGEAAYPSRQLHVIVPTSAGGVHDVIARIWADRVKAAFGAIVIENRAGGGSSIALNYVAQQPPDGHLLLLGSTSTIVLRAGTGNPAFDALKEVVPASIFAATSTSIAVNPKLPVKTVKELIAYVKANPGKLNYGSGGVGAITHIAVELFKQRAGNLDILHVPYRGMGPAMNDMLGGQVSIVFPNITTQIVALHRAGRLRILAVNAPARLDAAPDIPTASEAGLPGFVSQIFFGLFLRKGTPQAILAKIDDVTQKAWADKAFQAKLVQSGFELMLGYGPKKAAAYLDEELATWGPIVRKASGKW
jgi:tripartite-type tricarboxylate transporter receptor subunit TctC